MQFTEHRPTHGKVIRSHAPGNITVEQQTFQNSLLIFGDTIELWPVNAAAELGVESAVPLLAYEPELIVIGTGSRFAFPDGAFQQALREAGVGCEPMATDAACRTFNVLVAEERQVLGAFIL